MKKKALKRKKEKTSQGKLSSTFKGNRGKGKTKKRKEWVSEE